MFILGMLLITVLLLLLYLGMKKPKGYPPGPTWWPILGCLVEVNRLRKKTGYLFKTCSALVNKYGPVVGLKLGSDYIVVLNDYDSTREMLNNEDCDGRPIGLMYKTRTFGIRRGLIVVDGKLWVEQRRFVLRQLREFGFGRTSMATIIEEEAQHFVQHLRKLFYKKENNRMNNTNVSNNNNMQNDGQIYRLIKKTNVVTNKQNSTEKILNASDMYISADKYLEVRNVSQSSGIIISMHDAFGVTVLNTLWRMIAGKRYNSDDKELIELQRILARLLLEIDMIGAPFNHFPVLRYIAPEMSGYKRFLETHQQIWKFLKNEVENHKSTFQPNASGDLIDTYLAVLNSENYSDTFSECQLFAICVDLFIAGSETTSKALGFCFLYLVLHPHVQKKAQEEIDKAIGRDRYPSLADRSRMSYVNAVVLESIRLFMGRTLNVPHRALKDTTIKGFNIPKDTMIVINFNQILMNESWDDPEVFRPERFIDEDGHIYTPPMYFPFGIGRHHCIGETLARSNLFVIITTLLQTFTFSVVPGEKKPTAQDFVDGVTASTKPFRVMISLRS